jgi:putative CocE/NonD family hydrolase
MTRRRLVGIALFGWLCAAAAPTVTAQASPSVEMRFGVRVPLRGGDTLHATLYLPRQRTRRLPLIVTMTPYTSDTYHARAAWYARHGYLFAVVDVRGRGNSTGRFAPFVHDATDGYDAVEWLARLPECDGQVGMWGGSYGGFAQWATAGQRPPSLRTIVPAAAVHPGFDFPTLRGITFLSSIRWLAETGGRTANNRWGEDDAFWNDAVMELHRQDRSLRSLDTLSGFPSATFQQWLDHPTADAWWAGTVPSATQLAQLDIPVLTITGYYDVDQPGALRFYHAHRAAAPQARHHLLLGPWDHSGTRTPQARFSGVVMGPRSVLPLDSLLLGWYDHVMRGAPLPTALRAPIRYYRTNSDRWSTSATLEQITRAHTDYVLAAPMAAQRGRLLPHTPGNPVPAWTATIAYDPADSARFLRDSRTNYYDYGSAARIDRLGTEALRFETPPLRTALALAGRARLAVTAHGNVGSADLAMDLYVVRPDGSTIWLTGDMQRITFVGDTARRIDFESLNIFERTVRRGDRLRLVVTTPHLAIFAPNFSGDGAIDAQRPTTSRSVRLDLRHERLAPALLSLPIARP